MKVYLQLILTALFWGGTFIAGKSVAKNLGPFSIAFLRFATASIFLIFATWKTERKFPPLRKRQFLFVILLGMTGIFTYNVMFFKGLKIIEASRAALVIATCPVFITIASSLFLKERINISKAIGILISVCGAIFVISKGDISQIFEGNLGRGELYIFCCVLSWVAYSLIGKAVMNDLSPLVSVSYSSVVGAVALAVPAYFEGLFDKISHIALLDWVSILYLSIFGTVIGFVWYYKGIQRIGPTKAGLFINLVPIFAILLSFLILREAITISLLIGAVLVISGVYITNTGQGKKAHK
ncbi:MAG: DMT family transporter [Planctomycetota bacterium]|jgi:drug/metabolite transporter (DMT)-like permease